MNKDQRLLEEAYRSIYESKFYTDPRLTKREQEFVNKVVDEIVDNNYTIKYTDAPTARVDEQERNTALATIKKIIEYMFKDFPGIHIPLIRAAHQTLAAWHSTFTEMIKAKLVPEDKKDREEIKDTLKNHIATYIAKFFEDAGKPGGFLIKNTAEYLKHREEEIKYGPMRDELPELKGIF